jgi:hypothetical protein
MHVQQREAPMVSALKRKLVWGGAVAAFASAALCLPAIAAPVVVSPSGEPPSVVANILYGKLGDTDPWGNPAEPGCTWSRIQGPTSNGLQWQAEEQCNPFW